MAEGLSVKPVRAITWTDVGGREAALIQLLDDLVEGLLAVVELTGVRGHDRVLGRGREAGAAHPAVRRA